MFKIVCLIFFFTMMPRVYGQECKVYGISDSPQKLDCSFDKLSVDLRCKTGTYYLNQSRVNVAFHMEVEEGATPLVFKASQMQMTVLMESKNKIFAELEQNGRVFQGRCR